ncbi:MAG: rRNA maturation RNase YbeY [Planctomycetota bacterium]
MEKQSSLDVTVQSLAGRVSIPHEGLRSAASLALSRHRILRANLHIVLVKDQAMRQLHGRYLGKRSTTDVLTFDATEPNHRPQTKRRTVEGDIVVNVDAARREAKKRDHRLQAEMALYVVHGTLHLLGFDDHHPASSDRMHAMEDDILTELGWGAVYGAGVNRPCKGKERKRHGSQKTALRGDRRA